MASDKELMKYTNFVKHLALISLLACFGAIYWYIHKLPFEPPTHYDLSSIQTGDLILSEGVSIKSRVVKALEKEAQHSSKYSHIGIFVKTKEATNIVHMSIDDGFLISENLEEFITHNKVIHYDIYRIKEHHNRTHNLYKILDSLILIKKPFDKAFDMTTEDAFYCTELVYKVFLEAGITNIKEISYNEYLYPNDFINSNLFIKLNQKYETYEKDQLN